MHDLGTMVLPDLVLDKHGPLSPKERELVEAHPLHSHEVLRKTAGVDGIAEIVLYHHERYDGSGYPAGLEGWDIPLGARIIAAVDAFDAMTSERPYRPAMPRRAACDELIVGKGTQFDPEVVDALLKALKVGLH
jgi:polar amino acid transport system substrate-binding protein